MTILVCEDDALTLKTVEHSLKKNGYNVITAPDGGRGSEILKERGGEVDFMVTDHHMPYFSGLELLHLVRVELRLDIPVIMLTRVNTDEIRKLADSLQVDEYVTKPFNPQELCKKICNVLERNGLFPEEDIEAEIFRPKDKDKEHEL